ncbi:MAG: hypothetical protein MZU79_02910 [Anaerotruncus sp.]|nr:hypothetical protein [Anaerotruncus sp.]
MAKDAPGLFGIGPPIHKMGLLASNTVELVFEDCEAAGGEPHRQGGDGLKIIGEALEGGRVGIAALKCTGMLAACLDEAIKYASERKQFGKPLVLAPGDPVHDRGDRGQRWRPRAAAHAVGRVAQGRRPSRSRGRRQHREDVRLRGARSSAPARRCRSTAATGTRASSPSRCCRFRL